MALIHETMIRSIQQLATQASKLSLLNMLQTVWLNYSKPIIWKLQQHTTRCFYESNCEAHLPNQLK